MPERSQAEVAYRIATMENITPAVLKEIEESLGDTLRYGTSGMPSFADSAMKGLYTSTQARQRGLLKSYNILSYRSGTFLNQLKARISKMAFEGLSPEKIDAIWARKTGQ